MVESSAAADVQERFTLERCLGEGASGAVYRAVDHTSGMTVAVKLLTRLDPQSLLRFKSEFRSLANISHPNLLQLYDLVARGHEWLLSMELIEGGDFLSYVRPLSPDADAPPPADDEHVPSFDTVTIHGQEDLAQQANQQTDAKSERRPRALGELDEPRLRSALLQLCEGLHALHSKDRLHRDLKPANVLVSAAEDRVVICDFGLVVEETAQAIPLPKSSGTLPRVASGPGSVLSSLGSSNAEIAGTLAFMAPEQALGRTRTSASDWYAVG